MNYIWNENYPIAIHITEGEYSPEQLQYIANTDQLIVRDMRANAAGSSRVPSIDYYPTTELVERRADRWPNGDKIKKGES